MTGSLLCAIRGPVLLITLGVLLALDQMGPVSFGRTWPALLIVFGLFKLAETAGGSRGSGGDMPPASGPPGSGLAGGNPQ
jgi:hypothetical protein